MVRTRLVLLSVCVALIPACGSNDYSATDSSDSTAFATTPTTTTTTTIATTTTVGRIDVHMTVGFGGLLTDGNGRVVYVNELDSPNVSNCRGCEAIWPAVYATGELSVDVSLDINNFGTMPSGQVTFEEMPLYYYAQDVAPGDTNGDGIGGIWSTVVLD